MVLSKKVSPSALEDPGVPVMYHPEFMVRPTARMLPGKAGAAQAWLLNEMSIHRISRLVTAKVRTVAAQGVRRVWIVMNTPETVAFGLAVAEAADVPVVSLVWDCPAYFLQERGFDTWSRKRLMRRFGACLGRSERVGVVSDAMRETYTSDYGAACLLTRYGTAQARTAIPRQVTPGGGALTIGYAGALYALSAWSAFMAALDRLQWRVGTREIRLELFGSDFRVQTRGRANVSILGWRDEAEVLRHLEMCDLLYLPQPFEAHLQRLARLSFPTKLSTYAATGRPVLLHAPDYASMAEYFRKQSGTIACAELSPQVLADRLHWALSDAGTYACASQASVRMAHNELNDGIFRRQFAELLGMPDRLMVPV
jgi:hypothetical protein